jgi:hypothetical protein
MGVVVVGLDDVSLEVETGLDELLVEYVQVFHESVIVGVDDQLHMLQAWRSGPRPLGRRRGMQLSSICKCEIRHIMSKFSLPWSSNGREIIGIYNSS